MNIWSFNWRASNPLFHYSQKEKKERKGNPNQYLYTKTKSIITNSIKSNQNKKYMHKTLNDKKKKQIYIFIAHNSIYLSSKSSQEPKILQSLSSNKIPAAFFALPPHGERHARRILHAVFCGVCYRPPTGGPNH